MPFQRLLKELVESVPEGRGAVFADWEGEIVASYSKEENSEHIKFIGAHHGILLDAVRRASSSANLGETNLIMIKSEKAAYITAPVYDGYYLVLAVSSTLNPTKTQMKIDDTIERLRKEMGY